MRQQYLLHKLLLGSIAAASIAQVMLGAGAHAFLQVTLLKAAHKCRTHHGAQIAILTVRLLQAVEAGRAAHIHHR